ETNSNGTLDFPGGDVALDPEVSGSFTITINQIVPDPTLNIEDQNAAPPNQIIVESARLTSNGFVVVYDDDGSGGRNAVIGSTYLDTGTHNNVVVTLSRDLTD